MINHRGPVPLPLDPMLARYTGYLLRHAFLRTQGHAPAIPPGWSPRVLEVLTVLIAKGPMSQTQVGELLSISRTNMVKIVDNLEEAGYVQRQRDPVDRRRYALRVTAEGSDAHDALRRLADEAAERAFAALSERQRADLNRLLRRLMPELLGFLPVDLTTRTGFLLAMSHHQTREQALRALSGLGLVPHHFGMLTVLESAVDCSQQRLADRMHVTGPAIVKPIDELDAAGLVRRERNPGDRREHILHLTDQGRARLTQARRVMDGIQEELTGRLGDADLDRLHALLITLAEKPPSAAVADQAGTADSVEAGSILGKRS